MRRDPNSSLFSPSQHVNAHCCQSNLVPQMKKSRRGGLVLKLFLLGVCSLFLSLPGAGQSTLANISGDVVDPSGTKVAGAEIQVKNVNTGVISTAVTNSDGRYDLPALPPGIYTIAVMAKGFRRVERTNVTLNVQDVKEFHFPMEIGSASETVTVAGTTEEVQISPAVSTVVDRDFVGNIPLNGRTLQNLVNLTPGVVQAAPGPGDEGQFSVNGQRANSNYYTVDGVSANAAASPIVNVREMGGTLPGFSATGTTSNLVSVDAVQEFRIQTSTFAPEFGRTPGAQVSIATRSGTNQFHGTLFEYLRNDVLDAGNWFNGYTNTPALPTAKERQNDFGGVFGGAIFKDKTFFFFSYEGSRLRQPSTLQTLVPDTASRAAGVGTAVQPLLDLFPLPTGSEVGGGIAEANATVSNPSSLNAFSLRIDHTLKKNWMLFARYNFAPSSGSTQGSPGSSPGFGDPLNYIGKNQYRTQTGTAGVTTTFGPHMANEFLFNYTRNNIFGASLLTNFGGATAPTLSQLIPPSEGITVDPSAIGYELNVIGLGIADFGRVSANIQRQLNSVDNFSVVAGKHALKFGVDYRRLTPLSRPPDYIQLPVFCGVASCPFLPTTYLLSQTALEAVVVSDQNVPILFNNYSLYAQDTWAVTPRLTLTYGLRWEFNPAPTGQDGVQLRTFVDPYNPNLTLAPAGTPFYQPVHDNVAPRVGLAFNLKQTPGHEIVVRGGFGIFYDLGNGDAADAASAFPYYRLGAQLFQPYPFVPDAVAPIPFSLNPPYGQIATTDPNLKLPKTYQWNASLQQALGKNQTLTMTYVGAAGRDLTRNLTLNPPTTSNGELIIANGAVSNYNGAQIQFQRNLAAGLQVLASYTWSHSIDTQSVNSGGNPSPPGPGPFSINNDRGNSDFDVRHSVSGAVTYAIPGGNFGTAGNALLHGWGVDTILVARSATPVGLSASENFVGENNPILRPDIVPGQPFYLYGAECASALQVPACPGGKGLNPNAFTGTVGDGRTPPGTIPVDQNGNPLRQGTLGRNQVPGFGATQLDFALRRQFHIYEGANLQFRGEFFNLLNHPNFTNGQGYIYSSQFGLSPSTLNNSLGGPGGLSSIYQIGGPRSIQVALKLVF